MKSISASTSLSELDIISSKYKLAYRSAGVECVQDLLEIFPSRHEDRKSTDHFPSHATEKALCLRGLIADTRVLRFGGRKQMFEAVIFDQGDNVLTSNKIKCRWFNMPWLKNMLAAGHEIVFYGKAKELKGGIVIDHPDFEIIEDAEEDSIHLRRIVPVYKALSGVKARHRREHVYYLLENLDPSSLSSPYDIDPSYPRHEALREAHFPESVEQGQAAQRYFALEEFFFLQLGVLWKGTQHKQKTGASSEKKQAF